MLACSGQHSVGLNLFGLSIPLVASLRAYQLLSSQRERVKNLNYYHINKITMSQTTKKPETMVECYMSAKEYYDFRLLALERQAYFNVKWNVDKVIVTTTAAFLVAIGFNPGVDF